MQFSQIYTILAVLVFRHKIQFTVQLSRLTLRFALFGVGHLLVAVENLFHVHVVHVR